jgi:tryptophan-rich sensory protein
LNTLWSIIFFGWHNPAAAFAEIVLLWLAIVWTITLFWKVDKRAGWLMAPYILWVSFAAFLNYNVWLLNS